LPSIQNRTNKSRRSHAARSKISALQSKRGAFKAKKKKALNAASCSPAKRRVCWKAETSLNIILGGQICGVYTVPKAQWICSPNTVKGRKRTVWKRRHNKTIN